MKHFKLKIGNFKDFIKNSKLKLENNLYSINHDMYNVGSSREKEIFKRRIIRILDKLTQKETIIWSKDSENSFRGIVMETCSLSDYRIIVERSSCPDKKAFHRNKTLCLAREYKVFFIKGIMVSEKTEYIFDFIDECDEIVALFKTIEGKLLLESN